MDLQDRFDKYEDEFLRFDHVENKRSRRKDIHAILMLDDLFPSDRDIICAAEHDIAYLSVDDTQAQSLTDEQICELSRCGVHFDLDSYSLAMFC